MEHASDIARPGVVAGADVVVLGGLVGLLALPTDGRVACFVVMMIATLVLVALAADEVRRRRVQVAVVIALPALGMVGSVIYLHSLPAGAIPLAGIAVLALSLVSLVVSAVALGVGSGRGKLRR